MLNQKQKKLAHQSKQIQRRNPSRSFELDITAAQDLERIALQQSDFNLLNDSSKSYSFAASDALRLGYPDLALECETRALIVVERVRSLSRDKRVLIRAHRIRERCVEKIEYIKTEYGLGIV